MAARTLEYCKGDIDNFKGRLSTIILGFFSGSDDRSVRLWDLATGQCKFVLKTHTCADICFDNDKVITASFDNTVGMWDWKTGEELQCFRGHTAAGKESEQQGAGMAQW